MKKRVVFLLISAYFAYFQSISAQMQYPKTATVTQTDDYFGTKVQDPYRWLENSDAREVKKWAEEQNKVTFAYLNQIPYREALQKRLQKVWNFPKMGVPTKVGDKMIVLKNNGLQNQYVYYLQDKNGKETVLLDPNTLSKQGTVAINSWSISENKHYFAYSLSKAGSDWSEIYVIDLQTLKTISDKIEWVKFSGISWYKDGFYYSRYDAPQKGKEFESKNEFHKVFYHKIGTSQTEDALVFEDKNKPLQNFGVSVNEKAQILYLYAPDGTGGSSISFKDLAKNTPFKSIISSQAFENSIITTQKNIAYLLTNQNAPKYRLVAVDLANPQPENWKNILPEAQNVLTNVEFINNQFVATYMQDASHRISTFDLTGKKTREIELPTLGTVSGISGDKDDKEMYFSFGSFLYPTTIFKFDFDKNKISKTAQKTVLETYFKPEIDFKASEYETKEVFYPSKDGKKVHLFLTYKKGLQLNGSNPTYLYGYGGFNISINPSFDVRMIPFLEAGGVYAVANLRGGSEYGEAWHEDGMLFKKQNVFDDFIAAAEFLIKEKYTSTSQLCISGRSNGGLLVGACMAQRPDLFGVALPGVGVLDMLRYHKFTIGWAWANEYGSSDKKEHFENIYKYSPLHNLKPTQYPATMVFTADHDDRVVPAHSYKFISTLQNQQQGKNPTLIRIDIDAGHGAGKPVSKQIDEWADIWAFVLWNMGVKSLN